jgi:predicted regulator of Ras-like GTPase activity (Roadblock/LC7/MglB family)
MFKETLASIVDGAEGGIAGLLMDFEGIPVEVYSKKDAGFDVEVVGAEVSVLVKSIQRATEMLDAGSTHEVAFQSERLLTLVRVLNENYFLAVALRPDGNYGKARFLLRTAAPKMLAELV